MGEKFRSDCKPILQLNDLTLTPPNDAKSFHYYHTSSGFRNIF